MHSLDKALPMPMRSSKRRVSRRPSSTGERHPGFGDALPRIIVIIGVSFVTGFNERSNRGCTKSLLEPGYIDELFRPGKPFQKPKRDIFVQMGLRLQSKWLKKPMETQLWEMASLVFSYSLY